MKPFYMDVETIPCQLPGVRDEFIAAVQAPAQYKKADSIAAWLAENRETEGHEAWLKTSFDGGFGHIVATGFAVGNGKPHCYGVDDLTRASEVKLLQDFFCALTDAGPVTFVGHNIIGFDLPFIWKRAMVLGVKPPGNFPRNPKPWSELVCDTMVMWDASQRAGGSMDKICRLMGIPGKGDFGGADVWPAVERGDFAKVRAYCCGDIERTRAMHQRMTFAEAA